MVHWHSQKIHPLRGPAPWILGGGGQTLRNSKEVGEKDTFPQDEGKHDAVLKGQRERGLREVTPAAAVKTSYEVPYRSFQTDGQICNCYTKQPQEEKG